MFNIKWQFVRVKILNDNHFWNDDIDETEYGLESSSHSTSGFVLQSIEYLTYD